jgi:hypothetical protein
VNKFVTKTALAQPQMAAIGNQTVLMDATRDPRTGQELFLLHTYNTTLNIVQPNLLTLVQRIQIKMALYVILNVQQDMKVLDQCVGNNHVLQTRQQ